MVGVWYYWTAATSTDATTTANDVWNNWTTGTGTALTDTWSIWSDSTTGANTTITYGNAIWAGWSQAIEESKAQKKARLKQEREWAAQAEERRRLAAIESERLRVAQAEAVAKAEVLLREHLAEPQRADYDRLKEFLVKAQSGRTYRIKKGWSGNVELLDDEGAAIMRFCIHPSESCPDQDNMLAQKLLLESDEDAFDRIANKMRLRQPVRA